MRGLASIADEHQLPLQSHLSENLAECEWVRSLHPDCESYSDVYDKHGLYTPRSYMAHCVHCARAERDLVLRKGVGIVHCPNSNFTLASGVCNVREWLEEGHKVGLGTDVAGGYSPCILNAIRMARVASVATTAPVGGGEASAAVGAGGGAGGEAQHHVTLSYNGKSAAAPFASSCEVSKTRLHRDLLPGNSGWSFMSGPGTHTWLLGNKKII